MLVMYPQNRIQASEAIKHPWFDDIRMMFPNEEYLPYSNLYWVCLFHLEFVSVIMSSLCDTLWVDVLSDAYAILYFSSNLLIGIGIIPGWSELHWTDYHIQPGWST